MIGSLSVAGTSFLHRMDPRTRLLALPALVAVFLVPASPVLPLCYALALAVTVAATLGWRELAKPLRAIAPALLLIVLLTPPFSREGGTLLLVAGFPLLTTGGVRAALVFVARLTGISLLFYGLLRTQEVEALIPALRWFGLPHRAALVITITFRYVPFLASTWQNVRDAHRLRAAGTSGRRGGLTATWLPVLASVLIQAVRGIPSLAMALEGRGLGRSGPRSSFVSLGPLWRFALESLAVAALAAALLAPLLLPAAQAIFALPGL